MRSGLLVATAVLVATACGSSGSADVTTTVPTTTTTTTIAVETTVPAPEGTVAFEVEALGLRFLLADSYSDFEDPSLLFLARSNNPPSVFTIAGDDPSVVNYPGRPGETVIEAELDGLTAVVIFDAALEGLPDGLSANELLVANGDRSFTVIMSAPTDELGNLWDIFMLSVSVA